ncbi:serine/threonine-protein kinase [Myxococcus qinghaiensis]|uniref:serine/threonine-protein kinase n=1 Tax=Myxococcus qinghaiensis TaxID=2906758 RepID=UPI0020A744BC|nr:serine/threonine-protein kinase [Myxococcus qinghaiensis]MCP3166045.1 tetratricopeptide repeat-containing serine/threonine protein kinase [Myxococcus qinghaiensis]
MTPCPDENELLDWEQGRLSADAVARLETHLDGCAACCAVVAGLRGDGVPSPEGGGPLAAPRLGGPPGPGARVGRYVLLRRVGEGGMGIIFAAYDPDLDREVALKLVKPEAAADAEARGRLVREAQALARLSHPNVVTVHDVGLDGDTVFLAMELVRGRTLRHWLAELPRPWHEVLSRFLLAGQGLAAAHAVGLVHRDFKPDNVLLGDDGQVRVTDFGLARAEPILLTPREPWAEEDSARQPLTTTQADTRTGVRRGTPAYMSPEQWQGLRADARSDQFSFCVALYEALFGHRPFAGATTREHAQALREARVAPPPRGSRVPGAVRHAVLRGLAAEPSSRHPSMVALLARLESGARSRRWRWVAAALATGVAASAAAGFGLARGDAARACTGFEGRLEDTWGEAHRVRLEQRFRQGGPPVPGDAFESTTRALDAYAQALVTQERQSCVDTRVRQAQSERLMDLRAACLDGRRQALRVLVELLERGEREALTRAPEAARQLPSLAACENRDALARVDPLPESPEARRELARLRQELDGLRVQGAAGFHERVLPRLEAVVGDLRGLGHRPTLAGALLLLGELRGTAGSFAAAREALEEAVRVAEAGHDDEAAARAWNRLLYTEVQGMGLVKEAQRTARMAEAALERLGPEASLEVAAELHRVLSSLGYRQGDYARALTDASKALALLERARGPRDVALADVLTGMGVALNALGRHAEAEQHHARALALVVAVYGREHPLGAVLLNNVATALRLQGKVSEAVARHGEALDHSERVFGVEHSNTSMIRVNLGDALARRGQLGEAIPHYERALASLRKGEESEQLRVATVLLSLGNARADLGQLAQAEAAYRTALEIQEARLGPRHPDVALSRNNLGSVAMDAGRLEDARALFGEAHALWEATLGPDHPKVASALYNLGHVELCLRRVRPALVHLRRSLAVREKALGAEHPRVAQTLGLLGEALLEGGRLREAREPLERAVALAKKVELAPAESARANFALARVLWPSREERPRALALAREAQKAYARSAPIHAPRARAVRSWLATHDAPSAKAPRLAPTRAGESVGGGAP